MKSTGILRRIDDLGRIVIPKEIRKNLRIRDGESLEIFIENNRVILKKHSMVNTISDIAKLCVESFSEVIDKKIIITDRDKIIAHSINLSTNYLNKEITTNIENIILGRRPIVNKEETTLDITAEDKLVCKYVAVPILVNGDSIGLVLVLSFDETIDTFDETITFFISKFIGKNIEL